MLTIPKQHIIMPLVAKGLAVFSIGFVGSIAVLNYFHPSKSDTSTTSGVIVPGPLGASGTSGVTTAAKGSDAKSGGSTSDENDGPSAQGSATVAIQRWSGVPYSAPSTRTATPQPAMVSPSVSMAPIVSHSTTATAPSVSTTPAPVPSGSGSPLLPSVNLQGSTGLIAPVSSSTLPLN